MSTTINDLMSRAHALVVRASAYAPAIAFLKSLGHDGGVYFLHNKLNGLTKIGCSKDAKKRARALKYSASLMAQPVELELLYTMPIVPEMKEKLEQMVHKDLWEKRVEGEWYRLTPEDIEDMKAMAIEYVELLVSQNAKKIAERFITDHSPHTMLSLGRACFGQHIQPSYSDVELAHLGVAEVADFVETHKNNDWPGLLAQFNAAA